MKKGGILNAALMYQLTALRHGDKMVICDAGYPIPKDAVVIDISLVAGVPDVMTVLEAVLNEIIVEECSVSSSMKERNPEYYHRLWEIFRVQNFQELEGKDFSRYACDAKFFIRTAELKPYSNIILVSASGVASASSSFDISF